MGTPTQLESAAKSWRQPARPFTAWERKEKLKAHKIEHFSGQTDLEYLLNTLDALCAGIYHSDTDTYLCHSGHAVGSGHRGSRGGDVLLVVISLFWLLVWFRSIELHGCLSEECVIIKA